MTRKPKALGRALVAVLAIGAVMAQGASGHEFKSSGNTVITGHGTNHEFVVGTLGIWKCAGVTTEATQAGTSADTLTVTPHYTGCTFGGQNATVNLHHCAYVFDSDTTAGNTTGGEHAKFDIECEGTEGKITIVTPNCTLTIAPQEVNDSVRYDNLTGSTAAVVTTAHGIDVGNLNNKAGCVLFPKGKVVKYTGTTTTECLKDEGSLRTGTDKTTPTDITVEGSTTACEIDGAP